MAASSREADSTHEVCNILVHDVYSLSNDELSWGTNGLTWGTIGLELIGIAFDLTLNSVVCIWGTVYWAKKI